MFTLECMLKARTVFCYVSTKYEVDTINIINRMFLQNKSVCVPKINTNTNQMIQ